MLLFWVRVQFIPRLDLKDGQLVCVTGTLAEEPQVLGNQQKFKLGQFEIWAKRYPEYHYGDWVEAIGKVKAKPVTNLPLSSFNYPLTSFNTYQLDQPELKKSTTSLPADSAGIKSMTGTKSLAINLRIKLLGIFNRVFPRPLDGIMAGVVLGDKSMISQDFWQKLQQTGTLHIMVASGMNIAMFSSGILSFFLLLFKRRLAICCLIVVIWFYSIMTGMAPPMVRAACMASLIYLGGIVGRETEGGRVLFLTGLLMVFGNPLLIFDVGFQLSFMATAGLVYIQPLFCKGKVLGNNSNFSSSLAAQIATLPILVVNFGQLNLLSPLINLIILWTIPFILQLGMVLGLLGLLWIKLANLASYLVYPLLFFLEQTITFFAKITFFQIELPKIGWWWTVGYYFILWLWAKKKSKNLPSSNGPLKSFNSKIKESLKEDKR